MRGEQLTYEQYGVRFRDGSVRAPWNGPTQRQRAEEFLAEISEEFPRDAPYFQLVWRPHRSTTWRPAPVMVGEFTKPQIRGR